jgi:hypothetical protein
MLDERPSATELIAAVATFLEKDVAARVEGHTAFHLKVAVNALRIVERELAQGPVSTAADAARLAALLELPADTPLAELNRALCARLRAGDIAVDDTRLRDHLWQSVLARMAIDSPRYPQLAQVPPGRREPTAT